MRVLVTGAAGFIGADLCLKLLGEGHTVIGLDNFNDYYDVQLKRDRKALVTAAPGAEEFTLIEGDIRDRTQIESLYKQYSFDCVVNLAAQAGVRYSIENPQSYIDSNLVGFGNILEACRQHEVSHLVYASSSSVYGANRNFPFRESDRVDNPVSLYAATKKANELMAHSYASLYGMRCTGLRFFTVYGPWGRPDMAPHRFASRMLNSEPIPVYNNGDMIRDFTYVDDITAGVMAVVNSVPSGETTLEANYKLYNIGRGEAVPLLDFIQALERHLGVSADINMMPMQDGDVPRTMADTSALQSDFAYQPKVSIDQGVAQFADWYKRYYRN